MFVHNGLGNNFSYLFSVNPQGKNILLKWYF
jgi:hypothetical protein